MAVTTTTRSALVVQGRYTPRPAVPMPVKDSQPTLSAMLVPALVRDSLFTLMVGTEPSVGQRCQVVPVPLTRSTTTVARMPLVVLLPSTEARTLVVRVEAGLQRV